jgi:hypothetical protein
MGKGKDGRTKVTTRNEEDRQIHDRKKNWLEHLQRMPSDRAPKQLLYYQPIGRHDTGRLTRRWLDVWGRNGITSETLAADISCDKCTNIRDVNP